MAMHSSDHEGEALDEQLIARLKKIARAGTYAATGRDDKATADDVFQDSIVVLLTKMHDKVEIESVEQFFFGIVLNIAKNTVRQRRRHRQHLRQHATRKSGPFEHTGFSKLCDAEQAKRVRQAIETLSESDQNVLRLRYFDDLTVRELAEVLEKSPGAASEKLRRARAKLRKLLELDRRSQ